MYLVVHSIKTLRSLISDALEFSLSKFYCGPPTRNSHGHWELRISGRRKRDNGGKADSEKGEVGKGKGKKQGQSRCGGKRGEKCEGLAQWDNYNSSFWWIQLNKFWLKKKHLEKGCSHKFWDTDKGFLATRESLVTSHEHNGRGLAHFMPGHGRLKPWECHTSVRVIP